MIQVAGAFPAGASHGVGRLIIGLKEFCPPDFEYETVGPSNILTKKYDLVVSHYGYSTTQLWWAFISPKVLITELQTPQIMSYFTEKDLLVSYSVDHIPNALNQGINALLWPRPVKPNMFYKEDDIERDIDILMPSVHNTSMAKLVTSACNRTNKKYMLLTGDSAYPAPKDFCHDDKSLRGYYNRAKYVACFVSECHYGIENQYITRGYEVGLTESVFCGATPILFNTPSNKDKIYWHGKYAKMINEEQAIDDLCELLTQPYEPISQELIDDCIENFNAPKIWNQFWDAVRQVLL